MAQGFVYLLSTPAVSERDSDGALGVALANDMLVEFENDFFGGEVHGVV